MVSQAEVKLRVPTFSERVKMYLRSWTVTLIKRCRLIAERSVRVGKFPRH